MPVHLSSWVRKPLFGPVELRIEPCYCAVVEFIGGVRRIGVQALHSWAADSWRQRYHRSAVHADGAVVKPRRFRLEAGNIQRPGWHLGQTARREVLESCP